MLKNLNLLKTHGYINGQWVGDNVKSRFDVTNAYTNEVISTLPDMGKKETDEAILAANAAWPEWRSRTAKERAAILKKWFDLIMSNQEDLAMLMTAEQGKPLAEARGEVGYGASFIEWFAEEGKRTYGDVIPTPANDRRILVIKQPIGVVASITPWNFPIAMITRKCAPALAAGCPVVIKPAAETPLSALAIAELADQAGIPKGIINVIVGTNSSEIGLALTDSKIVRKLSFTGSTAVGKILTRNCADTMKKVSMELGGNAPFIVFDDADIDAAVAGAMISKFRNTGQTCVCTNRFLVQEGIYEEFVKRLADAVKTLNVGNGMDEGVNQGPLISLKALDKVKDHLSDAVDRGAVIVAGGKPHQNGGTMFEPTVVSNVDSSMKIASEETFGPLAPIFKFSTEQEAIDMANDTEFGLASYFFTNDINRIWRVSEALEYGMVGVNEGVISNEVAPFGGIKESGLGREGSHYGIDDFLELKYICMGGLK
ncbi:NAD-dependent succinate-semialdehyde dehydrogenase [Candidatus Thioglobus sp. NP1]|uniref:NAD-dependent succinate-semialdehyde dehydrogenase n=1 Tax=Candidatus Thioglobus sp. NP1 TaxID=2508687 RepID=UPI000DEDE73E|nr:NAD-dependent succinate-semialdehyde dehydrogenase [Candidatus Thioglobus sp. NP1]AXE62524.1 succinate-semialdehyde dehydrogenase (NADP(+)) [Candidatus Thioglobus sp. NP1]